MKLVKLPVIFEVFAKMGCQKLRKKFYFRTCRLWKRCCKAFKLSLNINQRVLPTPHIYYTHLTSAMFEQFYVSHYESMILAFRSFTTSVKWLLAYFILYFLCFEIFNNVNKVLQPSLLNYDLRFFYLKTRGHLLKFLNIFMMKRNK